MPCFSPIHGYASKSLTKNGKRKIVFQLANGYADKPMTIPCGVCIGCRIDRSRQWALRCVHESKMHETSCFVTLTYDDEHLPQDLSLDKSHLQLFFKRLRNRGIKFRYYACGEYGEENNRPHYHAIIFGYSFLEDRKKLFKSKNGDQVYRSDSLNEIWGFGMCTVGSFNYASAAYVARYCMKKKGGKMAESHYSRIVRESGEIIQVVPEFALMSLRPGIGSEWYAKFKKDVFPSDFLIHDSKKHSVPRYYLNKLEKEDLTEHAKIKSKRKKEQKINAPNMTSERLAVRETVKKSQISLLKRNSI